MGGRAAAAQVYPGKLCEAMCRGLAKQKIYDQKGMVCTLRQSQHQARQILSALLTEAKLGPNDVNDDFGSSGHSLPLLTMEGRVVELPQHAHGTGPSPKPAASGEALSQEQMAIDKPEVYGPAGDWLENWADPIHESDGGADIFGASPQNGQEILLAKLSPKDGSEFACDDASGVELVPELVRKARQTEMSFFEKMHV